MMNREMSKRIAPERYDECGALFVSEFGYVGPPGEQTVRAYLEGAPFDRAGRAWQHHNNTFEQDTVDAGVAKHYTDPSKLSPEDYLLYAGLVQGTMLGYALDALRARQQCHGSLFWMYNDCWGEVGWTIIDYYLRRKISWYFVRRAFAPRRLILRRDDKQVLVILANDAPKVASGPLEYGCAPLEGPRRAKTRRVSVRAFDRAVVARFPLGKSDPARTVWFAASRIPGVVPGILRLTDVRRLSLPSPRLRVKIAEADERLFKIDVGTDTFAHAVRLSLPEGAVPEDNYFDLLPGEKRSVLVKSTVELTDANVSAAAVVPPRA
jgi:beta-mannosidase